MQNLYFRLLFIAILFPIILVGQSVSSQLFQTYEKYKEPTIKNRRFKHKDIIPLIQKLSPPFEIEKAGKSMEGRAIFLVKIGKGKTKVLLWSQMHGDESTATMALMDIFNFFSQSGEMEDWKKNILNSLTLYFIPMLNPDGADRFRRRTALNIDLNRTHFGYRQLKVRYLKHKRQN